MPPQLDRDPHGLVPLQHHSSSHLETFILSLLEHYDLLSPFRSEGRRAEYALTLPNCSLI